ncbi:MAG TPA: phosphopantothenoylcysteine decarboxylase, partial [Nocardioides sp.]|nr:phosphopantothenoylcysteine decarboxylase [Nocardioides sp.]
HDGQVLVGFAAETDDVEANALRKLRSKRLDLIVANDVSAPGAGFEHDTNHVTIFGADGSKEALPLTSKQEVAGVVLDAVARLLRPQPQQGAPRE